VVEVRHATWNDKAFYAMLHERGVGFCNIDQPVIWAFDEAERALHKRESPTCGLHGRRYDSWFSDDPAMPPSERYKLSLLGAGIEPWAARIRHLADDGDSTFVVTNNVSAGGSEAMRSSSGIKCCRSASGTLTSGEHVHAAFTIPFP